MTCLGLDESVHVCVLYYSFSISMIIVTVVAAAAAAAEAAAAAAAVAVGAFGIFSSCAVGSSGTAIHTLNLVTPLAQ